MKEAGISKCEKRKWNFKTMMSKNHPPSNMQQTSHSFLQMENGIHFVMDTDNFKYSTAVPIDKNIELSRKTYSKKNPIMYHPLLSPGRTDTFDGNFAPKAHVLASDLISSSTLKCPSPNTLKDPCMHKKLRSSSDTSSPSKSSETKRTVKKIHIKTTLKNFEPKLKQRSGKSLGESSKRSESPLPVKPHKTSLKSFDKKLAKLSKKKSLNETAEDEDSDIEVLEVKIYPTPAVNGKSVTQVVKKQSVSILNGKRKNNSENDGPSKKKNDQSHISFMANDEVLINEADTAPFMPNNPNTFAEVRSSLQWLSANGQSHKENNCESGGSGSGGGSSSSSSGGSSSSSSGGGSSSSSSSSNKSNIRNNKSNISSLNKQANIKNTGPVTEASEKKCKGRRELKSLFENLNEISWAHETSFKNMLLSPASARHPQRGKVMVKETRKKLRKFNKTNKVAQKKKKDFSVKVVALKKSRLAKINQMKAKPIARNKIVPMMNKIRKQNFELENKASFNANRSKPNVKAQQQKVIPKKVGALKTNVPNDKESKPDINKLKGVVPKLKTPETKSKSGVSRVKPAFSKLKLEDSEPSTSGLNGSTNNFKSGRHLKVPKPSKDLKNFNGYQSPNKVGILQSVKKDAAAVVQKGSKLQVRLKPLEHTNLWTASCFDEIKKTVLDHASSISAADNKESNDTLMLMLRSILAVMPQQSPTTNDKGIRKKKSEEEASRSSARQSEGAFRYKEIVVKKHPSYIQVVLVPNEVKQNCLTIEAMKEIKEALVVAKKDPNCKAVLLNSSGRYFCSGIDLSQLVGSNRKQVVDEMALTIQDLVLTLSAFSKPVIAAVNGATLGFGVTLLTYCDVVLASDKATFCVPAIRLGYLPEGGITLTLPEVVGTIRANEMLIQGRCLTAEEALRYGLVSELMWPTTLMNNVIPRLENIIDQSMQAMEMTKTLIRCNMSEKLKLHTERERRIMRELWLGAHCQNNIKRLLQTGYLID